MYTSKKQLVQVLKHQIRHNTVQAQKALLKIYSFQSRDEKITGVSIKTNGMGFTQYDSKDMGELAQKLQNNEPLTLDEHDKMQKVMQKYASQLINYSISTGKIRKVNGQYIW